MTDVYPPFRLDQGGEELRTAVVEEPPLPPPADEQTAEAAEPAGGGAGGVALIVVGVIAAVLALGLLVGGAAAVVVDQVQRDDDGFLMSPTEDFSTATYAIASRDVDVEADWGTKNLLGTVRIRSDSARPVFVGIGREADVDRYLGGVAHAVVTDIGEGWRDSEPHYEVHRGGAASGPPAGRGFWAASATGAGEQTLEWEPEDGSWKAVVMNADGSRGVAADLSIGVELDPLVWIGLATLAAGVLLALCAALAISAGIRRGRH
jgi:hypothetical protein